MSVLYFVIPGKAKGKDRPRFGNGSVHTSPATAAYEKEVGWRALEAMKKTGFKRIESGPITMSILVRVKQSKKTDFIFPVMKPDFDNVSKIISDALNKVAFDDDKQIANFSYSREWGPDDCVSVEIAAAQKNFNEDEHL